MTGKRFEDQFRENDFPTQTVVKPASNLPYVIAVVVMILAGVLGAVILIVMRPTVDNTAAITTLFGFIAPTTLSLLAFMKSQETHLSVNSRLDAFMANAKAAASAKGYEQGRQSGRDAADARTDLLAIDAASALRQTQTPLPAAPVAPPPAVPVQVEVVNTETHPVPTKLTE